MKRRMYWGVAILIILLIGVSVFMLTRTTETEPKIIYNPPTEAEKKQVERNIQDAIDKEKKNLPPIAEEDRPQVVQVSGSPNKNSQQNDSVETVQVENYLEGLTDIDLFESITNPTDAELASYSSGDIMELNGKFLELDIKLNGIYDKYFKQMSASSDAMPKVFRSGDDRAVDQWLNQDTQFIEIGKLLNEQRERLRKEKNRVRQHTRGF